MGLHTNNVLGWFHIVFSKHMFAHENVEVAWVPIHHIPGWFMII
jgi:hypothetical protein